MKWRLKFKSDSTGKCRVFTTSGRTQDDALDEMMLKVTKREFLDLTFISYKQWTEAEYKLLKKNKKRA